MASALYARAFGLFIQLDRMQIVMSRAEKETFISGINQNT